MCAIGVDFDFGPNGRMGGFDLWRLNLYRGNNPSRLQVDLDENNLARYFEDAVVASEIKPISEGLGAHLYYLTPT